MPLAVAVAVLASVMFGGTAAAYWRTTGTGTGSASTGTLTFSVTGLASTDAVIGAGTLYPGASGDLLLRYDNTNAFPVQVAGMTSGTIPQAAVDCRVTTSLPSTFTDSRYMLAAGPGALIVPGAVLMGLDSPSSCQGASFTIPLTVKVQK